METVRLSVEDMEKLGISWTDFCDFTGYNVWAINEGMDKGTIMDVPVKLIKP